MLTVMGDFRPQESFAVWKKKVVPPASPAQPHYENNHGTVLTVVGDDFRPTKSLPFEQKKIFRWPAQPHHKNGIHTFRMP